MPRPVPRRRSESDAPDADEYAPRRGRGRDEEPDEERRPRRGRGELPDDSRSSRRGRDEEPEEPRGRGRGRSRDEEPEDEPRGRRGRSRDPEPDPEEGEPLPASLKEVKALPDDLYDELTDLLGLKSDSDERDVWEAVQEYQAKLEEEKDHGSRGRGRGRSRDDEEPDEPRGRGRGRSRDEEEDEPRGRGRGRGRGDDEDEEPRRVARRGFAGFKKTKAETSNYADDFKLTEDEVLVKFLEDEPFAAYGEHGLYKELTSGQRVWTCLAPEEECPICNTGHQARAVALWNIVVIPEEGKPQVKVLKAGPMLEELIEKKASLKTGPMSAEYYSLSQTPGKNDGPPQYAVEVVRERDLKADWKEDPFTDKELDAFEEKAYDETFVKYPSVKDSKEIARKLRSRD